jgi:hypothetical protein
MSTRPTLAEEDGRAAILATETRDCSAIGMLWPESTPASSRHPSITALDPPGSPASQRAIVRKSNESSSSLIEAMVTVLRVLCTTTWEAAPKAGSRESSPTN